MEGEEADGDLSNNICNNNDATTVTPDETASTIDYQYGDSEAFSDLGPASQQSAEMLCSSEIVPPDDDDEEAANGDFFHEVDEAIISEMKEWLVNRGKDLQTIFDLMKEYIPSIKNRGIHIDKLVIETSSDHPQAGSFRFEYEAARDSYQEDKYEENPIDKDEMQVHSKGSPFAELRYTGAKRVRYRRTDPFVSSYIRPWFMTQMYTDYYALPFYNRDEFAMAVFFATRKKGGFSDSEVAYLDAVQNTFGLIIQLLSNEIKSHSLLCTYLGKDAGSRVYKGSVNRGDGLTVRSVIWFSDIRGFTSLSNQLDRDSVISLINDVFQVTQEVLSEHGGEILKFMGDGLLAVFIKPYDTRRKQINPDALNALKISASIGANGASAPSRVARNNNRRKSCFDAEALDSIMLTPDMDDSDNSGSVDDADFTELIKSLESRSTGIKSAMASEHGNNSAAFQGSSLLCVTARKAAVQFQGRLKELRAKRAMRGQVQPQVGVGLHYGDCSYGNIGAPGRLDFTVIGPSVNLASRVEGLTSKLGASVLATEEFVRRDKDEGCWSFRGEQYVKGVPEPAKVYELAADDSQHGVPRMPMLESGTSGEVSGFSSTRSGEESERCESEFPRSPKKLWTRVTSIRLGEKLKLGQSLRMNRMSIGESIRRLRVRSRTDRRVVKSGRFRSGSKDRDVVKKRESSSGFAVEEP